MTAYWTNDVPAEPFTVPAFGVDLGTFTGATATLTDPAGVDVPLTGASLTVDADDRAVYVNWGTVSRFTTAGLYSLQVRLTGTGSVSQYLDPAFIPVQVDDGWLSLNQARQEQDANFPDDDLRLWLLLQAAKTQCIRYAPVFTGRPPLEYRVAQLMQAKNILNASRTDPAQSADGSVYVIRPYPLDKFIKGILRPVNGVPFVV